MGEKTFKRALIAKLFRSIDQMFDRQKAVFLGDAAYKKGTKVLALIDEHHKGKTTRNSLHAIFKLASELSGDQARPEVFKNSSKITATYLDVIKTKAKAKVLMAMRSSIENAKKEDPQKTRQFIEKALDEAWQGIHNDFKRVVETETTANRNLAISDSILRVHEEMGESDPTVAFLTSRDNHVCAECKRLHLLDDKLTPRAWKMSQVSSSYHKKGENTPSTLGAHARCRCSIISIPKGYGFVNGRVQFISKDHDEYAKQNQS